MIISQIALFGSTALFLEDGVVKAKDLRIGMFVAIEFGDVEFRCPRLVVGVSDMSFRMLELGTRHIGKFTEDEFVFDARLYIDPESCVGGDLLLDVLRIVPETEVLAYLEEQAKRCDKDAEAAHKAHEFNLGLATTYREKAKTIFDEAHALIAKRLG